MLSVIRRFAAVTALLMFVALVSAALLVAYSSPSFQKCYVQPPEEKNAAQKSESTLTIVGSWLRGSWPIRCSGDFVTANKDEVIAVATAVIAAFTITLWGATSGQLRHLRMEYASTHRPRIYIQRVELMDHGIGGDEERPAMADLMLVNGGDTRARIIGAFALPYVQTNDSAFTPRFGHTEINKPKNLSVATGEFVQMQCQSKQISFEYGEFTSDKKARMFLIGRVTYIGDDGITRNTGFCREYSRDTGRWHRVESSEYEYAY